MVVFAKRDLIMSLWRCEAVSSFDVEHKDYNNKHDYDWHVEQEINRVFNDPVFHEILHDHTFRLDVNYLFENQQYSSDINLVHLLEYEHSLPKALAVYILKQALVPRYFWYGRAAKVYNKHWICQNNITFHDYCKFLKRKNSFKEYITSKFEATTLGTVAVVVAAYARIDENDPFTKYFVMSLSH